MGSDDSWHALIGSNNTIGPENGGVGGLHLEADMKEGLASDGEGLPAVHTPVKRAAVPGFLDERGRSWPKVLIPFRIPHQRTVTHCVAIVVIIVIPWRHSEWNAGSRKDAHGILG